MFVTLPAIYDKQCEETIHESHVLVPSQRRIEQNRCSEDDILDAPTIHQMPGCFAAVNACLRCCLVIAARDRSCKERSCISVNRHRSAEVTLRQTGHPPGHLTPTTGRAVQGGCHTAERTCRQTQSMQQIPGSTPSNRQRVLR